MGLGELVGQEVTEPFAHRLLSLPVGGTKQLSHLGEGEAESLRTQDEPDPGDGLRIVAAVARGGAMRRPHEALCLPEAKR